MRITRPLRVSPSAIEAFNKCSLQYKLFYLEGRLPDSESDNLYSVLGNSIHRAAELNDLFNISYEELKKSWKIIFLCSLSEAKNLPKNTEFQSFLSRGYDILRNVFEMKKRWKDSKILGVETPFQIKYKNSFVNDVFLTGKVDLIIKNDNGIYTGIDWKTSKTPVKQMNTDLSMAFYIFYIHVFFKVKLENIFGAMVYPSIDKVVFTQRDEEGLKYAFGKVDDMIKRISKNDFKRDPKINNCLGDCFFCSYKTSCESDEEL